MTSKVELYSKHLSIYVGCHVENKRSIYLHEVCICLLFSHSLQKNPSSMFMKNLTSAIHCKEWQLADTLHFIAYVKRYTAEFNSYKVQPTVLHKNSSMNHSDLMAQLKYTLLIYSLTYSRTNKQTRKQSVRSAASSRTPSLSGSRQVYIRQSSTGPSWKLSAENSTISWTLRKAPQKTSDN